jgi:hypothetical protein
VWEWPERFFNWRKTTLFLTNKYGRKAIWKRTISSFENARPPVPPADANYVKCIVKNTHKASYAPTSATGQRY